MTDTHRTINKTKALCEGLGGVCVSMSDMKLLKLYMCIGGGDGIYGVNKKTPPVHKTTKSQQLSPHNY